MIMFSKSFSRLFVRECIGILLILVLQIEMKKFKTPGVKTRQAIQYNEPVIGILTQEVTGKLSKMAQGQYVLSSYVNMIEAAGARVVPFLINQTPEQVERMFTYINGIVLPGGHVKLQHSKYGTVGKQLFELAKKANDKGDVFPIWCECLGLELIALLASGRGLFKGQYDTKLFDYVYAKNVTMPLTMAGDWKKSKLYGSAPADMLKFMTTQLKGFHNHNKAITMKIYKKFKKLSDMFSVVSTNKDKKGKEFISTFEGKKYPFYLLHWHPSKSQNYAPYGSAMTPDQKAVWAARFLVGVFINQARMSKHRFPDEMTKARSLINNFPVIRNNEVDGYFTPM